MAGGEEMDERVTKRVCRLHHRRHVGEEEDELSEVEPDAVPQEVREWLASTFTRQLNTSRRKTDEKPRFR